MVVAIARALEFVHPSKTSDAILLTLMAATFLGLTLRLSAAIDRERGALRHANRELEAARGHWRMVFDASPDALISFDGSALHAHLTALRGETETLAETARRHLLEEDFLRLIRVMTANRSAKTLFGHNLTQARFAPGYFNAFCDALEGTDSGGVMPPFEIRILDPDGPDTDLQVHVRLTTPPGAAPWSLCLSSYVDVSAAHRLARAEAEARHAAERAHQARNDFLAAMSHDIRTPLNGVLGMAQAMAQEPLSARQRERLEVIRSSGEALSELVDRLTNHAAPADSEPAATSAPGPGLRILAAEDNSVNRMVLKALLEQLSVEPTLVENGEEAVMAWESATWDLILMDVQMPVMDGPAATMRIRAREAVLGRQRTPIVAVTANTLPHQVESYFAAGMDDVVRKPFSVTELFEAISGALEPSEPEAGRRSA